MGYFKDQQIAYCDSMTMHPENQAEPVPSLEPHRLTIAEASAQDALPKAAAMVEDAATLRYLVILPDEIEPTATPAALAVFAEEGDAHAYCDGAEPVNVEIIDRVTGLTVKRTNAL